MNAVIRNATPADVPAILRLVRALAEYEKLAHLVTASEKDLDNVLFNPTPHVRALLALVDQKPVGFALFFKTFSTFLGKTGLYLEDLFVEPEFRGQGIGKRLLASLAKIANEENCGRVEWAVLTWNQPSIDFYHQLGAVALEDWRTFRLTGDALEKLARHA